MRYLLVPLRAVLLVLHILIGIGIAFVAFPLSRTQARRNRINHWWSQWVLRLCGVRLRFSGQSLGDELSDTGIQAGRIGRMLLSNHISWIDIFAINAVMPCRFVAKADIVRWPIIGGMLAHSGTLFIERGRRSAVATMNVAVQGHLRAGESIGVFPEGTTTRGDRLLTVSFEPAGAGARDPLPGLAGWPALHGARKVQRRGRLRWRDGARHIDCQDAGRG